MHNKSLVRGCGSDSPVSGQSQMPGSFDHSDGLPGLIKGEKLEHHL